MVKKISAVERRHQEVLGKIGEIQTQIAELPAQLGEGFTGPAVAAFYFQPTRQTVAVSTQFVVEVRLNALEVAVDSAQVYIDFDPACLQINRVFPGWMFEEVIYSSLDSAVGQLGYAAGMPLDIPGSLLSDGALLALRCQALKPGMTQMTFATTRPRETKCANVGYAVPVATDAVLTVTVN